MKSQLIMFRSEKKSFIIPYFRLILCLVFFNFIQFNLHGQGERLYNFINPPSTLTTEQSARWGRIQSNSAYLSFQFIELNDFVRDPNYEGNLVALLPSGDSLTYKFSYVEDATDELVWYGEYFDITQDTVYNWGSFLYIDDESGKFGQFSSLDSTYEIIDLSSDLHVLATYDTLPPSKFCYTPEDTLDNYTSNVNINPRTGDICRVQIFVAYLGEAEEKVATIEQRAKLDIKKANLILRRSGVSALRLEFEYIGKQELLNIGYSQNHVTLAYADIKGSTEIASIRSTYSPDIVLVYFPGYWIHDGSIVNGVNGYTDLASMQPPDLTRAFLLVDITYGPKYNTFAHEAAHIVGARHEIEVDETGLYQHAHELPLWTYNGPGSPFLTYVATVMWHYSERNLINNYSNPDIRFGYAPIAYNIPTVATGTSTKNNARILKEQGCITSLFKPRARPFTVEIDGPSFVEYLSYANLYEAVLFDGHAPYLYEWFISLDGMNFTSLDDTDASTYVSGNFNANTIFVLKVVVTDDLDFVDEGFLRVFVYNGSLPFLGPVEDIVASVSLIPNPAIDELEVEVKVYNDEIIDGVICIYNFEGVNLTNLKLGNVKKGVHNFKLKLDNIVNGTFIVSLQDEGRILDNKLGVKIQ